MTYTYRGLTEKKSYICYQLNYLSTAKGVRGTFRHVNTWDTYLFPLAGNYRISVTEAQCHVNPGDMRLRTLLTKGFQTRGKVAVAKPLVYIVKKRVALPIPIPVLPSSKEGLPNPSRNTIEKGRNVAALVTGKGEKRCF